MSPGPALAIAQNLSPQIDAVISGHTHQAYNCTVSDPDGQPRLLTSASSFGRMVTDVHLLLDPKTKDVVRPAAYAVNKIVTNTDVAPVPALTSPPDRPLQEAGRRHRERRPGSHRTARHAQPADSRTADADGSVTRRWAT